MTSRARTPEPGTGTVVGGGDAAFGADEASGSPGPHGPAGRHDPAGPGGHPGSPPDQSGGSHGEPKGLPDVLTAYLLAEQRLGRIKAGADVHAASMLVIGAMHGQILPKVLFSPPGTPIVTAPGLSARLAETILSGLAPD